MGPSLLLPQITKSPVIILTKTASFVPFMDPISGCGWGRGGEGGEGG